MKTPHREAYQAGIDEAVEKVKECCDDIIKALQDNKE